MKKHYLILVLFAIGSLFSGCSKKSSDPAPTAHATFNFAGAEFSGPTTAVTYNGGIEVNISGGNGKELVLYNVPSAEGGTFNLYNAFDTGVLQSNTDVYASSNINIGNTTQGSASASGTLTKTGARSFSFSATFRADLSGTTTATVVGSGTY
jgi:hypothetical protein